MISYINALRIFNISFQSKDLKLKWTKLKESFQICRISFCGEYRAKQMLNNLEKIMYINKY